MSGKQAASGGGREGASAETVEQRNQRWKEGGKWKFLNVVKDGVHVTYTAEASNPNNLVWVKRSDLPDDVFMPVKHPDEQRKSGGEPGASASKAKPSAKGKASKKTARSSSSEHSDESDAKSKRHSATPPLSADKRTRPERRVGRVDYSEEKAPKALEQDDQQLLADACEVLKSKLSKMGMGLSAADAHEKVLDFLLGTVPQLAVDTSTVSGHGGFTTCAVKTGTVLGLLTSEYHAKKNLRPKGPRISGIRYTADESWYMAGWVNSCCLVHVREKKRRKERVCPSNAKFRVFIVHGDEGVVRYVVLMSICGINAKQEVFAYYALRSAGPPPGQKDTSDLVDAASDSEESGADASAAGAPAAGASKQLVRTFRGRRIKHGSSRSDALEQGESSTRESKARDDASSGPRRGQAGFVRCRGGGSSHGAHDDASAAGKAPTRAVAQAAAKIAVNKKPAAPSSSSSSDQASEEEALVEALDDEVPESQMLPDASHNSRRGQADYE